MKAIRILGVALLGGTVGLTTTLGGQQPPAPAAGDEPDPVAAPQQSIGDGTKKLAQHENIQVVITNSGHKPVAR